MNGRLIFRKMVEGYRAQSEKEKPLPVEVIAGKIMAEGRPEKKEEKPKIKGIEIPDFTTKRISTTGLEKEEEMGEFQGFYPLIPEKPSKEDTIFAYTKIGWNPQKHVYEYFVVEPKLSKRMRKLFYRLKSLLEEKLDVDFTKLREKEAREYLHDQAFQLLSYFGVKLSETEKKILTYYINRDFLGMGVIEPLMHDEEIEDISADGVNIPIYVFHRNSKLGSIPTNIVFNNKEELDSYLVRLAQLCGQSISIIDPLLNGALPDGSRVQGTLGTDIARRGSNFTIRKFTKFPFTPTHLLNYETIDIKTLAFLWFAVDHGSSILVSGATATGKTVFLNVLSLFIRPDMKIVSIEDTPELQLTHSHWIPHVARVPIATETGKARGEVDLFDLLKESLRQRPDYIIVGEVRGKEAYVLFQQMALGHPALSTMHADSLEKLNDRLITPPIALPPSLIENLDLILFLGKLKYRGKYVRKVQSILEITGFNLDKKRPYTNQIFEWDADNDKIDIKNKSTILSRIIKKKGLKEKEVIEELKRRMVVLYWMKEQNIMDYRDVSRIISLYYNYPERVLDTITGET